VRGLGPTASALPPADFLARAEAALDRRLSAASRAPIAVAFSGGGDSSAMLLIAAGWAKRHARPLLALHVDHRLQPQGAAWAAHCAQAADEVGARFETLVWTGEKPARGLPAAARAARHRLIAEAARAAGARVVLFGHTADDIAEAQAMRTAGSTTPSPREWSPSPAWPEGRGLFLLRPLLSAGRAQIRIWLAARGQTWIDDPANQNPAYARTRARQGLGGAGVAAEAARPESAGLALACALDPGDVIRIARDTLRVAPPGAAQAFVATAAVCAGGGARLPRSRRAEAAASGLVGAGTVTATLAGARIEADVDAVFFIREAGEATRGGLAPVPLPLGAPAVWDGRYELQALAEGLTVRGLAGARRGLPEREKAALTHIRSGARGALPLLDGPRGLSCPLLTDEAPARARFLALDRLLAACGAITREPD
jgi:tRNA(Ile)-lysidine synthase